MYRPSLLQIKYLPDDSLPASTEHKKRSRNIHWFKPPFSRNVKTNIGRKFLNLVNKYFPALNKLAKTSNRNTMKISYSCMDNKKSVINKTQHTRFVETRNSSPYVRPTTDQLSCNCQKSETCPLQGKCLSSNLIYQAEVTTTDNGTANKYIGMTANSFKTRYNNHMKSCRNAKYSKETALSNHISDLKSENREYVVKWSILKHAKAHTSGGRRCNLCLEEKAAIMRADPKTLLNKRTEIISKCRHRDKYCLRNYATTSIIPIYLRNDFYKRPLNRTFFQLCEDRLLA